MSFDSVVVRFSRRSETRTGSPCLGPVVRQISGCSGLGLGHQSTILTRVRNPVRCRVRHTTPGYALVPDADSVHPVDSVHNQSTRFEFSQTKSTAGQAFNGSVNSDNRVNAASRLSGSTRLTRLTQSTCSA
ncbi:hypothetical protein Hdeb2414_s0011g00362311 [Helianthus debilis subsp. tardiflorus]